MKNGSGRFSSRLMQMSSSVSRRERRTDRTGGLGSQIAWSDLKDKRTRLYLWLKRQANTAEKVGILEA
jgi:hypothetical protein